MGVIRVTDKLSARLLVASPTERARALDTIRPIATPQDIPALRMALQNESVGSLRRQLGALIRRLELQNADSRGAGIRHAEPLVDLNAILEENAISWIRHELEPAIGWLRLAASREVNGFSESETNRAIQGLRRRLDNAEALVRATAPPKLSEASLSEVIAVAISSGGLPADRISVVIDQDQPDLFVTDVRLFTLIVQNAVANALDAISQLRRETSHSVFVSGAVSGDRLWLRVTNQFTGREFAMSEVEGVGVTGKDGHQGQGLSLMRHAAMRLGYDLRVKAEGGVAELVLAGPCRP